MEIPKIALLVILGQIWERSENRPVNVDHILSEMKLNSVRNNPYRTKMKLNSVFILMLLVLINFSHAQNILFPDLSGAELLDAVQSNYTPNLILSYAEARDTLYSKIDVENDSVRGIYTTYAVFLDPVQDPTSVLFAGGINTEHIYPQGRGATDGTPAYRNMHHLAASRVEVNQDRGNLPFSEISDNATDNWYYKDLKISTIPASGINNYSEGTSQFFEPRESVKGNVARAMFYIHAIYRDQVMAVDPTFFEEQRQNLCIWHFNDPVDNSELWRTEQIAIYQDGKENPFVLDCTLAERMYCSSIGACMLSTRGMHRDQDSFHVYYNSGTGCLVIRNNTNQTHAASLSLFNISGKKIVSEIKLVIQHTEDVSYAIDLPPGTYVVTCATEQFRSRYRIFVTN